MQITMKSNQLKRLLSALLFAALSLHLQATELPKDTFVRGGLEQLNSIDPLYSMDELHASVFSDLFEGLLEVTPEGTIWPAIAENWKISADQKTYTFALRQATWSDGNAIKASQFVKAILRTLAPSSKASQLAMLFPIKNAEKYHKGELKDSADLGVHALDEHTLSIELHTPTPHFLSVLAYRYLTPITDEQYDYNDISTNNLRNIPVNGPYIISSHEPKISITLKRNPNYWDQENVAIPKVKYLLGSYDELWDFYLEDKLDYVQVIPTKAFDWAKNNIASEILIAPQFATYFYEMDIRYDQLKNPDVRKALNLVLNRDRLTDSAIQPGHLPTESLVPPHLASYESALPSWSAKSTEERIHEAQTLMARAGFGSQTPLKISLAFNTSDDHNRVARAVSAQWQEFLPVEVELKDYLWNVYKLGRAEKSVGMINRYGWSGDYADPLAFLTLGLPETPMNYMGYNNQKFNTLLQTAVQTYDEKKRFELLTQAEQILLEDSVIIPLFHYSRRSAIKPRIYDWESNMGFILKSKYLSIG